MSEQVKVKIIHPDGSESCLWTLKGKSVWDTLEALGMDTEGSCGGRGTCGKCKVKVEGEMNSLTPYEREHLLPDELKRSERLACYATINGPVTIHIDYGWMGKMHKLALMRDFRNLEKQSGVQVKTIFIPGKEKQHPVPVVERLEQVLAGYTLDLTCDNLNELSRIDRVGRPTLELFAIVLNNQQVKYVGRDREHVYGVALDIGSTSLFAALVDLLTGEVVALSSQSNMQRVYGADILSRVSYCLENQDGLAKLRNVVINNINSMIEEMVKEQGSSCHNIYKMTVVGNPIMMHLFMGLEVGGFAIAPYTGIFSSLMICRAGAMGLGINPSADVLLLPQIGGFVGADTIAGLLSLSSRVNSRYLFIDIGTNSEIVVCNRGKMWAASAAAGPALEGGGISSGMRAGAGAVDKVWLQDGKLECHIINDEMARGICGSAIIDLIASLIEAGCLDQSGQLKCNPASDKIEIITGKEGNYVMLLAEAQTISGNPLVFNQDDIRQVQLAKGAIRTGIDVLLREAQLTYKDLDNIYMSGVFGSSLNPQNSITMGMIPPVDVKKIVNLGNAAGDGAIMALLAEEKWAEATALKKKIKYVELADYDGFQNMFMENMNF